MLKPSELCPASEGALLRLLPQYLDMSAVSIVTGGVSVVQALLDLEWDKIFFTGSVRVGKIVMAAAAKFLTPVMLELGGKSPCYIDSSVKDMRLAGKWTARSLHVIVVPSYPHYRSLLV